MGSGAGGGCGVGAGLPGMWPDLSPGVHTFWLNDLGKLLTPVQPRTPSCQCPQWDHFLGSGGPWELKHAQHFIFSKCSAEGKGLCHIPLHCLRCGRLILGSLSRNSLSPGLGGRTLRWIAASPISGGCVSPELAAFIYENLKYISLFFAWGQAWVCLQFPGSTPVHFSKAKFPTAGQVFIYSSCSV